MSQTALSDEEADELIRLVDAPAGTPCPLDPADALVLYALKLIAPVAGDRSKGYTPTKAGTTLANKLRGASTTKKADPGGNPAQDHRNTDPHWPFPIRIR